MDKLIKGLKAIKEKGGIWEDSIEDDNGLIDANYELAMNVLEWNPEKQSEKEFDDKMENLFYSL